MSVENLILERRTIHDYKPEAIDENVVRRALEISLWAPNHRLTFPWRYVWVRGEKRTQVAELGVKVKSKGKNLNSSAKDQIKTKLLQASELIVIAQNKTEEIIQTKEDYATLACSIQNMSLYLWEKGLGCKWSSGALTRHESTYELCNLDPSQYEIAGFVWIGIPNKTPSAQDRPPLDSIMSTVES